MKTLIQNGLVIDPANGVHAKLNLLVSDGKIVAVTPSVPEADRVIDASDRVVAPGFIDIHLHEDPIEADGRRYDDPEKSVLHCMLRMGVTTVLGGNCGSNVCDPGDYLDIIDRDGAPVNVAMLAGHSYFREHSGCTDRYARATDEQVAAMTEGARKALERGCVGVSFGVRYVPGTDAREILSVARTCQKDRRFIAAHIRDDADAVFSAAREFIDIARELDIPAEVSHIGSMAGFGQMHDFLELIDEYRMNGVDVTCDCYPYDAFSTSIGSTTYDDGWMERYHCGYDVVEICEGKYRGQRCTQESFEEARRERPGYRTICYVMDQDDVDLAFHHDGVMLGSDGSFNRGQGHPRAAGTFPRLVGQYVRRGALSLDDAIHRASTLAAKRMGLSKKGRLNVGADADIVIFDPQTICDGATFADPLKHPTGIDYVLVNGEIAMEKGREIKGSCGRAVRREAR